MNHAAWEQFDEAYKEFKTVTDDVCGWFSGLEATTCPCPYCGQSMRSEYAQQCRHCGLDWHDPANVFNRKGFAGQ